jgi:AcrR family transcriptional regulator
MRALARVNGMKLGALQYHFRTSQEMWQALVSYVGESYRYTFGRLRNDDAPPTIREIVLFILDDDAGDAIAGDRLWPQFWAMQQVEPLISDLLVDVYAGYLATLEAALKAAGNSAPRAEALCLMSLLEGSTIFVGRGRRWEGDAGVVRDAVLSFVDSKYGEQS